MVHGSAAGQTSYHANTPFPDILRVYLPHRILVFPDDDGIVITPQHTRELWGCLEGMSVVNINKKKVSQWLKTFTGAMNDLDDVPVIKRG